MARNLQREDRPQQEHRKKIEEEEKERRAAADDGDQGGLKRILHLYNNEYFFIVQNY